MSPHLCHVNTILSCLLLLMLGLCHSASLERKRTERDTRNIPSNKFKPVESSSADRDQLNTNTTALHNDDFSFSEQSTGEAQAWPAFDHRSSPVEQDEVEEEEDGPYYSGNASSRIPSRFYRPTRPPFPNPYRSQNSFEDRSAAIRRNNFEIERSAGLTGGGYGGPSYAPMPLSVRSNPSMTGNSLFSGGNPSFGGPMSSNRNYYRSESYSYSSDGMGAPQIQRSVFDSRLGHGIHSQNF